MLLSFGGIRSKLVACRWPQPFQRRLQVLQSMICVANRAARHLLGNSPGLEVFAACLVRRLLCWRLNGTSPK